MKKNPLSRDDLAAYLEYFYNDEVKAAKDYLHFIHLLRDNPLYDSIVAKIKQFAKQEADHAHYFRSLLRG